MKILFISSIVDDKLFNKLLIRAKKNKPSIAGQRFERLIALGLNKESDIEILSYIPTPPFPTSSKIIGGFKKKNFNNIKLRYIPLLNITLIKQLIIMIVTLIYVVFWCLKNRNRKKRILLNLVYIPTSLPVLFISRIFGIPVTVLVPDVSSYRFNYTKRGSNIKGVIVKIIKIISERLDSMFDGYIFLTEAMNDLMNKKNKPYIVIEGMIEKLENTKSQLDDFKKREKQQKYLMYAGSLREKYGIMNLIKAFEEIDLKEIELWIFGTGDIEEKIKSIALHNKRIKFWGLKPQKEVFKYEQKATLLVNPRPSNEPFTKYSFPSKTLEYMSSGTPLVTTRLPGIPKEYDDYLYFFEDESVNGIKNKLYEILLENENNLLRVGNLAQKFVFEKKNNIIQSKKIYMFLNKLN